jgi:predicted ATPase
MTQSKAYLKRINIDDYLSLHTVSISLRSLTVLVGPNASGKTNILTALSLINQMVESEELPPMRIIRDRIWAGGASHMKFKLEAQIEDKKVVYEVALQPNKDQKVKNEKLTIGKINVINVSDGKGSVKDEDNKNITTYHSKRLALISAGDYGNKPITESFNTFVGNWKFYDFDPDIIRGEGHGIDILRGIMDIPASENVILDLDPKGGSIQHLLLDWYENSKPRFDSVNHAFEKHSKFSIGVSKNNKKLVFYEGYSNPISLSKVSDGTLRLLAYLVLINQPELPSLVAIEEPERNLHPAWLNIISDILLQLSGKTQVIITTHSSQLLDAFPSEILQSTLGIHLLHNVFGRGTEVITLDQAKKDRKGLQNWIDEFGIGSALFDSEILQDIMRPSQEAVRCEE